MSSGYMCPLNSFLLPLQAFAFSSPAAVAGRSRIRPTMADAATLDRFFAHVQQHQDEYVKRLGEVVAIQRYALLAKLRAFVLETLRTWRHCCAQVGLRGAA